MELLKGKSDAIKRLLSQIDCASKVNYPIIIEGESGTGKELIAKLIHVSGARRSGPFVPLNSSSIPLTLASSELFGYTQGSFSGAVKDRQGIFMLAAKGTLFLDELENMPLQIQELILRFLDNGEVRPIGGYSTGIADVRIICATNEHIDSLSESGRLRRDLLYRLNVIKLKVPSLRERVDDIPILIEYFLEMIYSETGIEKKQIDHETLCLFLKYDWPGNVRELQNVLRRASVMSSKVVLNANDFEFIFSKDKIVPCESAKILSITEYARSIINAYTGKMTIQELADHLGVSRKTIWEWKKQVAL